eukprot:PhF_6_TR26301/c0_g1_i3/m.37747
MPFSYGDVVIVHKQSLCIIERVHTAVKKYTVSVLCVDEYKAEYRKRLTVPEDALEPYDPTRRSPRDFPSEQVKEAERIQSQIEQHQFDRHWGVCFVCGLDGKLLMCDGCMNSSHVKCANLGKVPKGSYYCEECKVMKEYPDREPTSTADVGKQFLAEVVAVVRRLTHLDRDRYFADVPTLIHPLDDYADRITHPMDLSLMSAKARRGFYVSLNDVSNDVDMIVKNCKTFNGETSMYSKYAQVFSSQAKDVIKEVESEMRTKGIPSSLSPSVVLAALGDPVRATKPLLWPSHGTFLALSVRISLFTFPIDGSSQILYTLDESVSPMSGTVYTKPFVVHGKAKESIRIRCVAQCGMYESSPMTIGSITFSLPTPTTTTAVSTPNHRIGHGEGGGGEVSTPPQGSRSPVTRHGGGGNLSTTNRIPKSNLSQSGSGGVLLPPAASPSESVMTCGLLPPLLRLKMEQRATTTIPLENIVKVFLTQIVPPDESTLYQRILSTSTSSLLHGKHKKRMNPNQSDAQLPVTPSESSSTSVVDFCRDVSDRLLGVGGVEISSDEYTVLMDFCTFLELNHSSIF